MTSPGVHDQQPNRQDDSPLPMAHWNRSHATRRLDDEMTRARRDGGYRFAVLLVEFDGLSESASGLGYATGEDVWRRALGFLMPDVGPHDLCCRLSGDEFLLILSGEHQGEARAVVERLRRRWNPAPGSRDADVRLSIGLASYPADGCTVEELLCAADEALHADRVRTDWLDVGASAGGRASAFSAPH